MRSNKNLRLLSFLAVIAIVLLLISGCTPTPNIEELKDKQDVEGLIKAFVWGSRGDNASDAVIEIGEPAIEPLIEALKDDKMDVRYFAAKALGEIGDERAVKPLIGLLNDEEWFVHTMAAEALVKIGEAAVEPLIETLKDENVYIRMRAVKALVEIGDSRAVEPLIEALKEALKDEEQWVREEAEEALVKIEVSEEEEEEEAAEEETAVEEEEVADETEEAEGEEEETDKKVSTTPTISLEIIEGPTLVADSICYYRVKAIVTGNPYPSISFNKDDSLGSWGKNISQVNLNKEGESFTLEATATNSQGTASAQITLTDTCERPVEEETAPAGSEIPIIIINDLGATLSLSLSGPASYSFSIPAGRQNIYVIPGTYNYTGRCSGAVDSGTHDLSESGSEWRWWWQYY